MARIREKYAGSCQETGDSVIISRYHLRLRNKILSRTSNKHPERFVVRGVFMANQTERRFSRFGSLLAVLTMLAWLPAGSFGADSEQPKVESSDTAETTPSEETASAETPAESKPTPR